MNGILSCKKYVLILFIIYFYMLKIAAKRNTNCPKNCECVEENNLNCENLDLPRIPSNWPSTLEKIYLKNSSLRTIEKNSFRRFSNLEEIIIERCSNLDLIDKFAFKGLSKLRFVSIIGNSNLKELYKASFSGIGNEQPMRIHIKNNALSRIRSLTFKNLNNVRELLVEDHCFEVESCAFASISKVDFLKIKGACFIDGFAFQNTSRIHNLNIWESKFELKKNIFADLNHVNQIQIQQNSIEKVEEDAFTGIFTIGSIHLQSNKIGQISPRAFSQAENLGTLVISYNTIREPMKSLECLLNSAQKFVFTENTLNCSCQQQWIQFTKDPNLLLENYCGGQELLKALIYYKPINCPLLSSTQNFKFTTTSPKTSTTPSAYKIPTSNIIYMGKNDPRYSQELINNKSKKVTFFTLNIFVHLLELIFVKFLFKF